MFELHASGGAASGAASGATSGAATSGGASGAARGATSGAAASGAARGVLVVRTCSVFRLAPAAEFCHTGCERTVSQQLTLQQLVCTMSECDP